MARNGRSIFKFSGSLGDVTFVRTKKGTIVRARRGTHKEAEINDAYKAENGRNGVVNNAAKLVHDIVRVYAGPFKKGDLWQDMLSRIRKCKSDDLAPLLKTLEGLEVNPAYGLDKIVAPAQVEVQYGAGMMTLTLHHSDKLYFELPANPKSHYFELLALLITEDRYLAEVLTINTGWRKNGEDKQFEASFEIPPVTRHYVIILKVQGGDNEKPTPDMRAMGMRVAKVGEVVGG
jgi:hypothetical protein